VQSYRFWGKEGDCVEILWKILRKAAGGWKLAAGNLQSLIDI